MPPLSCDLRVFSRTAATLRRKLNGTTSVGGFPALAKNRFPERHLPAVHGPERFRGGFAFGVGSKNLRIELFRWNHIDLLIIGVRCGNVNAIVQYALSRWGDLHGRSVMRRVMPLLKLGLARSLKRSMFASSRRSKDQTACCVASTQRSLETCGAEGLSACAPPMMIRQSSWRRVSKEAG